MNILKYDFYRLKKFKPYLFAIIFSLFIALALSIMVLSGIKLGISVSEEETTFFRDLTDIIKIGTNIQTILGILISIVIALFIGEEYQYKTWKLKTLSGVKREKIFISKIILSIFISVSIFLIYELFLLLLVCITKNGINFITLDYFKFILNSVILYTYVGSVLGFISIIIKSKVTAVIISLFFIIFMDMINLLINNIGLLLKIPSNIIEFIHKHSLYGMNILNQQNNISITSTLLSSIVLIFILSIIGYKVFNKYELE